jgi:ABC-type branched-subunit amino acid transport system substrate-binding protein
LRHAAHHENGSTANQVTEVRNLVQRDGVEAVVGYISSGNCLASMIFISIGAPPSPGVWRRKRARD